MRLRLASRLLATQKKTLKASLSSIFFIFSEIRLLNINLFFFSKQVIKLWKSLTKNVGLFGPTSTLIRVKETLISPDVGLLQGQRVRCGQSEAWQAGSKQRTTYRYSIVYLKHPILVVSFFRRKSVPIQQVM